uniref:universal stress protein n=3 Tax=Roseivirga sp. TaxID=1964215 RepID=UPI004048CDE4
MKKIIVPLDFSNCSTNALKNAITMADRLHARLILCHALTLPMGFAEGAPIGLADYGFDELQDKAEKDIKDLVTKFPLIERLTYTCVVQFGPLPEVVNVQINKEDDALVVMGTHGAKGFIGALLGTNTYNVVKHVKCPVLALPENADLTKMNKIALAGDYKNIPSHEVLHFISDLAKAFYAHLYVVHIDHQETLQNQELEIARSMEKYLKHVNHSFIFRKDDDLEQGLMALVNKEKIQLLAMISKHHSFIERLTKPSETKSIILHIPMPILVLQDR